MDRLSATKVSEHLRSLCVFLSPQGSQPLNEYNTGDAVEAFIKDVWWAGVVVKLVGKNGRKHVLVDFPAHPDEEPSKVRVVKNLRLDVDVVGVVKNEVDAAEGAEVNAAEVDASEAPSRDASRGGSGEAAAADAAAAREEEEIDGSPSDAQAEAAEDEGSPGESPRGDSPTPAKSPGGEQWRKAHEAAMRLGALSGR